MPEDSNVKRTFEDNDKFERKEFAKKLTRVITRYTPLYDEAFVLSLNAPWGSGKTTFLDMWQSDLETPDDPYHVIRINAWETDFDEEPLIPIISALLNAINPNGGDAQKKAVTALTGAIGALALVANGVVKHSIQVDILQVMDGVEADLKNKDIQAVGNELYQEYSFKKSAYEKLRIELQKYTATLGGKPLVIFVDELDRVRPDYAVKFLEAIKHIFSAKGVCFVIAVDKEQLEMSVRQLYGDIDFSNYYRRFIMREAKLPEISTIDFRPFIELQFSPFYSGEGGGAFSVLPIKHEDKEVMTHTAMALCKSFKFSPRQMKDWCRALVHFIAIDTGEIVSIYQIYASMLLIAISMSKEKELMTLYNSIRNDSNYVKRLSERIKSLEYSGDKSFEKLIMQVSMAFSIKKNDKLSSTDSPAYVWNEYCRNVTLAHRRSLSVDEERYYANEELQSILGGLPKAPEKSNLHMLQQRMEMWDNLIGEKSETS